MTARATAAAIVCVVLAACSRGPATDQNVPLSRDSLAAAPALASPSDTTPPGKPVTPAPAPGAPPPAPLPATGATVEVHMIADARGYRFDPQSVAAKQNDAVRWILVSGAPQNITFWPTEMPGGAAPQLAANMPATTTKLVGPVLTAQGATYTISLSGVPPGRYQYYSAPHLQEGMIGEIVVH